VTANAHRLATRAARLLPAAAALAILAALLLPAASPAAVSTVGSPLSVPATLNTAENLTYAGVNTNVPPSPEVPSGVVHTYHYGADGAFWNTVLAAGQPTVPAPGQAIKVSLEGCAVPSPGGPAPLTQIHFQTLHPLGNGKFRVELSSQPFEIPVCGASGASGATVSTYEPTNLCVNRGDVVAFNEEGGFVEHFYQSGVPYQVLGAVAGSSLDSFIKNEGTGNGSLISPLESSAMDGFAVDPHEELMLQVTLGTGPDARYVCPGGKKDAPPTLSAIDVHPQTDGINHSRIVSVAIFCRPAGGCHGSVSVTIGGGRVGRRSFSIPGNTTSHVPIRLAPSVMGLVRHGGVSALLVASSARTTVSAPISVKIF
jgi:hypothetical protein